MYIKRLVNELDLLFYNAAKVQHIVGIIISVDYNWFRIYF